MNAEIPRVKLNLRLAIKVHISPESPSKLHVVDTLVGFRVDISEWSQSKTESIVRAGEADITEQRRDHTLRLIISILSYYLIYLKH